MECRHEDRALPSRGSNQHDFHDGGALLAVVMFATNGRKGSTVGDEKEDCDMAMALMTFMMFVLPKCTM